MAVAALLALLAIAAAGPVVTELDCPDGANAATCQTLEQDDVQLVQLPVVGGADGRAVPKVSRVPRSVGTPAAAVTAVAPPASVIGEVEEAKSGNSLPPQQPDLAGAQTALSLEALDTSSDAAAAATFVQVGAVWAGGSSGVGNLSIGGASADRPPTASAGAAANDSALSAEDVVGQVRNHSLLEEATNVSVAPAVAGAELPLQGTEAPAVSQAQSAPERLSLAAGPPKVRVSTSKNDRNITLVVGIATALAGSFLLGIIMLAGWRHFKRPTSSSARQHVEQIRVATGHEIQSMFAMNTSGDGPVAQPMSPGILTRIHGRVVAKPGGALVAPFSGRPCVIYSASVSHHRQDGVHQPPLAYHTAGADFMIEVADTSHICMVVHSQDVSLFDMEGGRHADEHAFADAPDAFRGFVLAHPVPGSGGVGETMNQADLGGKNLLEFRECALIIGSMVTCIGEVARDRNGVLSLCPWRPPAVIGPSALDGKKSPSRWLTTSWESLGEQKSAVLSDPIAGHVMISDDESLRAASRQKTIQMWPSITQHFL